MSQTPEEKKVKLTVKQNAVIWCLQNGWILITDSNRKGAIVAANKQQYQINNGLFWRLVHMDLIYQGDFATHRYNYVLTELGKTIKTKPVTL
jgi:hypothetical protein